MPRLIYLLMVYGSQCYYQWSMGLSAKILQIVSGRHLLFDGFYTLVLFCIMSCMLLVEMEEVVITLEGPKCNKDGCTYLINGVRSAQLLFKAYRRNIVSYSIMGCVLDQGYTRRKPLNWSQVYLFLFYFRRVGQSSISAYFWYIFLEESVICHHR